MGVKGTDRAKVDRFGSELVPLVTSGPPGVTGFAGGRPKATEIIGFWPALRIQGAHLHARHRVRVPEPCRVSSSPHRPARSGDKGEGSNVGVIARSPAAFAFLKEVLTEPSACARTWPR